MHHAIRRKLARHPEACLYVASAAAWGLVMAEMAQASLPMDICRTPARLEGAATTTVLQWAVDWRSSLRAWAWMTVAMMLPLAVQPLRHAVLRSLWSRRHRAGALVVAAYLAAWLLAGTVLCVLPAVWPQRDAPSPMLAVAAVLLAAAWQRTPWKRQSLRACHRTAPLAVDGWAADSDCLRYGWQQGAACVASCWALMLAMHLAPMQPVAMATLATVGAWERAVPLPPLNASSGVLVVLAMAMGLGWL